MNNENLKKFFRTCLCLSILVLGGWKLPEDSPYVIVNSNLGSNQRITFGRNMIEYLTVTDYDIVSSYQGSLYGYVSYNDLRITFSAYQTPTYTNANYQTLNYTITQVIENHLYDHAANAIQKNYEPYIIALLGGILVICFFKK